MIVVAGAQIGAHRKSEKINAADLDRRLVVEADLLAFDRC
jgi:hypothetical protein